MDNTQNLHKEIIKISVPSFLETLFNTFTGIIDSKMVSALGVSAISAVSVTNQPKLFIFSIFFALQTVTTSLVAKYYGKDDQVSFHFSQNLLIHFSIRPLIAAPASAPSDSALIQWT